MNTMNQKLSEQLRAMEEMGIDTSKFTVCVPLNEIDGGFKKVDLSITPVEDKQLNHSAFRRWITAQTFRMLNYVSYDKKNKGWEAYLRDNYSYIYQFRMMIDEFKRMKKIKKTDKEEFERRLYFFNKNVVLEVCRNCFDTCSMSNETRDKLQIIYESIENTKYEDIDSLRALLIAFTKIVESRQVKIPRNARKCNAWKEAFKGSGAYYTVVNLILYHDVRVFDERELDFLNKNQSLEYVEKELEKYYNERNVWKMHYFMKRLLDDNNFDINKFKEKYSKKWEYEI